LRKTKKEVSAFVIKRGLWLIFAEVALNSLFWSFNPFYNWVNLQVLWAIGISMVILGLLIRLPYRLILALGLLIVLGHNLLDIPESAPGFQSNFWWDLLHHGGGYAYAKERGLFIFYPFLPWTGLMMLGYCTGIFYSPKYTQEQRRKILSRIGGGAVLLFIALRFLNVYGDPVPWTQQQNGFYTFLSFIKVYKYPPSLLYMCITMGIALMFLSAIENANNRVTGFFRVFGRTAFFYYILHVLLIHTLLAIFFFAGGHHLAEAINAMQQGEGFLFVTHDNGYSLGVVYGVWVFVVLFFYPICKKYDSYKTNHREKWWLSYL
jgi:uncharacterized membrane protein